MMRQSEKKMAEAIFPRSSANVKTWVSGKMAKDFNSSAPVEFLFPTNAKGSLQLPGEDERRGSELGSRRTSWISIKARAFMETDCELGNRYSEVIALKDIAIYACSMSGLPWGFESNPAA
ncbi:hypothetical protein RHSIM_Rhsim03G0023200 [Rhododendron simsii]|uniref:Uncharacterized protein n=1 Tax=Rhododendron simsii TaxID=118357 RepID=A0A834H7I6_RHOSS|nr:hypothetical protein RHSIM_Rhsim03G0023200 [Rhododendron simsii]